MLPGATPFDNSYGAWQEIMKKGKGRAVHFHWSGLYSEEQAAVAVDSTTNVLYENAVLHTDYTKIASLQAEFETAVRNEIVTITTPLGTNLSFRVGDRPVTKQDGDASKERADKGRNLIDREVEIPAGAIRTAPLEETVEGTIAYPSMKWGDQSIEGLVLTFNKGKITDVQASSGLDAAKKILSPVLNELAFRELVIGFNPLLPLTAKNEIPYYGYGAGVVRLSLGNNDELGGIVKGEFVYIRFFTDATVTVGKEVWVKDGAVVK